MSDRELDFVGAGWLRVFPEPALLAYISVMRVAWGEGGPVVGDLDDLDLELLGLKAGLDDLYIAKADPDDDEEDAANFRLKWTEWQRYAAEYGMPMKTYRDVFAFMVRIGLLEREIEDGAAVWRPKLPVPLPEDVLALSPGERRTQEQLRWHDTFTGIGSRIIGWLVDRRTEDPALRVVISINDLAAELELDPDDLRHGLICAVEEARDIHVSPDPEVSASAEPLTIAVDWVRFDEERISIRLARPDD